MSTSDASYEYFPLRSSPSGHSGDEFRLLVLLPGLDDAEIQCEIQHASLDGPPQYEALSYTWGDPKGEDSLVPCRGDPSASYPIKVDEGYLRIGYNLECALKQLRHGTNPRTLWIDAICINQDDFEEKNQQVKAMARIYSNASRVLAWLGEHDGYTDLAFETS
jgi:Heterokaryon incompatibility protein (HET)